MMFSPKEWMLVDRWQATGIPYEVVEKGISRTFERINKPSVRVNLYQCDAEIQRLWQWHEKKRVKPRTESFTAEADAKEVVFASDKIRQIITLLEDKTTGRYQETYRRMIASLVKISDDVTKNKKIDTLEIESEVEQIFQVGWLELKGNIPQDCFDRAYAQIEDELSSSKAKMTKQAYKETIEANLDDVLMQLVGFKQYNLFNLKL